MLLRVLFLLCFIALPVNVHAGGLGGIGGSGETVQGKEGHGHGLGGELEITEAPERINIYNPHVVASGGPPPPQGGGGQQWTDCNGPATPPNAIVLEQCPNAVAAKGNMKCRGQEPDPSGVGTRNFNVTC